MKKNNLILLLLFFPILVVEGSNKKYTITGVDIEGQLSESGSMFVTENRTYKFEGSFKYAFQK